MARIAIPGWLWALGAVALLGRGKAAPTPEAVVPAEEAPPPAEAPPTGPAPTPLPPVLPVESPSTPPTPPAPSGGPQPAIVDIDLARIFAGLTAHQVTITGIQADEELFGPQIGVTPGDRLRAIVKVRNIGQGLGRFRLRAALYLGDRKVADLYDVRNQWSMADTTLPAGSTGTLVMESLPLPFPGNPGQGQVLLDLVLLVTIATDLGELGGKSYILREAVMFREQS